MRETGLEKSFKKKLRWDWKWLSYRPFGEPGEREKRVERKQEKSSTKCLQGKGNGVGFRRAAKRKSARESRENGNVELDRGRGRDKLEALQIVL